MPNDVEFTVRLSAGVKLWLMEESKRTGAPQGEIVRRAVEAAMPSGGTGGSSVAPVGAASPLVTPRDDISAAVPERPPGRPPTRGNATTDPAATTNTSASTPPRPSREVPFNPKDKWK